jgi:hypothetical protein
MHLAVQESVILLYERYLWIVSVNRSEIKIRYFEAEFDITCWYAIARSVDSDSTWSLVYFEFRIKYDLRKRQQTTSVPSSCHATAAGT